MLCSIWEPSSVSWGPWRIPLDIWRKPWRRSASWGRNPEKRPPWWLSAASLSIAVIFPQPGPAWSPALLRRARHRARRYSPTPSRRSPRSSSKAAPPLGRGLWRKNPRRCAASSGGAGRWKRVASCSTRIGLETGEVRSALADLVALAREDTSASLARPRGRHRVRSGPRLFGARQSRGGALRSDPGSRSGRDEREPTDQADSDRNGSGDRDRGGEAARRTPPGPGGSHRGRAGQGSPGARARAPDPDPAPGAPRGRRRNRPGGTAPDLVGGDRSGPDAYCARGRRRLRLALSSRRRRKNKGPRIARFVGLKKYFPATTDSPTHLRRQYHWR